MKSNVVKYRDIPKIGYITRECPYITPMLYDLYSCVSLHPNYDTIVSAIKKYIPKKQAMYRDGVGNIIVKVGKDYTTMFSCHIDMIFSKRHYDKELPKKLDLFVALDQEGEDSNHVWGGVIESSEKNGKCTYTNTQLGADDKSGIYIMLHLIKNKIPGLYVFHIGEELGGIGSQDIKKRSPGLVKGITKAIAFDRMDYFDIINSQRGGTCCSKTFVDGFATQLNDLIITPNNIPQRYHSAIGSFTDTANYTSLIEECTNISVGYFNQHSESEHQDYWWLEKVLTPALLKVDWEALPVSRTPTKESTPYSYSGYCSHVTKYTTYPLINYSTPDHKLPPWNLTKGIIKSCTDAGMRKLIEKYYKSTNEYTVRADMLLMLKKIHNLEASNITNVISLPTQTKYHKDKILTSISLLLMDHFKIYNTNFNTYSWAISGGLEWAWKDMIKHNVDDITKFTDILLEMTVINGTLILVDKELTEEACKITRVISKTMDFLKVNYAGLGYKHYNEIRDELRYYAAYYEEEEDNEPKPI